MRARNIKPGTFKNEILGTADPLLTILFAGLWCLADRDGRLEDRPLRIKAEIFPYRELDVNGYLTELSRLGFIQRYQVADQSLIQILNFGKHQNPHHTEKKSELPAPLIHGEAPVIAPMVNGHTPADSLIPDSLIPDKKQVFTSVDASGHCMTEWNLSGLQNRQIIIEVLDKIKDKSPMDAALWLVEERSAYEQSRAYQDAEPRFRKGIVGWLKDGVWSNWRGPAKSEPVKRVRTAAQVAARVESWEEQIERFKAEKAAEAQLAH